MPFLQTWFGEARRVGRRVTGKEEGSLLPKTMAYPVPIVHCEDCERRFVLDPSAMVEDVLLEIIRLLCQNCRGEDDYGET